MRDVAQRGPGLRPARAAALRALLELGDDEGPGPEEGWDAWLAARNLRLVAARAAPAAGFWLARHGDRVAVMFGAPPQVAWDPGAALGPLPAGPPDEAWVLAALDPVLPAGALPDPGPGAAGTVEALFVAPAATAPMRALAAAELSAVGLAGDRYAAGTGTFSGGGPSGRALTLVEGEALAALDVPLAGPEARRNVVTRGIALNGLVGRPFALGDAVCRGARWCEPCAHLERLTRPGVLRGLVHRGGLRADVVRPGTVRVGDEVRALEPEEPAGRARSR